MPPPDLPFRELVNPDPGVETHLLRDDGAGFPNNDRLPLLILRSVLRRMTPGADGSGSNNVAKDPAAVFEEIFARWDWRNQWRGRIFTFHHYHSTSHEVLGCYAGHATVRFGGPTGVGITATLGAGDVVVIPAGVGHCNLGPSPDFGVVGAYPEGRKWDLLRGAPGERPDADRRIVALPQPANDPVLGEDGPLTRVWRGG